MLLSMKFCYMHTISMNIASRDIMHSIANYLLSFVLVRVEWYNIKADIKCYFFLIPSKYELDLVVCFEWLGWMLFVVIWYGVCMSHCCVFTLMFVLEFRLSLLLSLLSILVLHCRVVLCLVNPICLLLLNERRVSFTTMSLSYYWNVPYPVHIWTPNPSHLLLYSVTISSP